ncbi:alpha/beta hydrolase fold [Actinobaculum suis]|uniref:Alpha/beta hydrolase n=1 Tax=Actinobaculum suis TaxID=1657 RepID=A0A1G7CRY3_9ACTO|nr:alpha/beta hydrolase [Actinobaculum suis]MDY5152459.1 alpha/beta hydrolase [Actinobaculum suis]SDE42112.1 alpha/beta hydrolase fold [Actinobaculum suis]
MRKKAAAVTALVALVMPLALAGCGTGALYGKDKQETSASAPGPQAGAESPQIPAGPIPEGLEEFYNQPVEWKDCGPAAQCTDIQVPLDYAQPEGKTITVAMKKRVASGKKIGTLFVNPGGPGGSGIEMVDGINAFFSDKVLAAYDVVGFDPRGVGKSTPVKCLSDAELDRVLTASYPDDDPETPQKLDADLQTLSKGCDAQSGELLPYVGTNQAARDLDVMRALTGEEQLTYVGYSYGTLLGTQYMEYYPQNVGRMILDGAVDPSLGIQEMSVEQTAAFETVFRRFMADCLTREDCPFHGTVDEGIAQMQELLARAQTQPYEGEPGRPVNEGQVMTGLVTTMYDPDYWPIARTAFGAMQKHNDASTFQLMSDLTVGRKPDGSYDNSSEANFAINCADYPAVTEAELAAGVEKAKDFPILGAMYVGSDSCKFWSYHPDAVPGPFTGKGAPPVVVVGTRYDPATPYQWSENLAKALESAVLVTYEGDGHTAYNPDNQCIAAPLDKYLLEGTVPQDGLTCPAQ